MHKRAVFAGLCLLVGSASAQAFCALRDPVRNIVALHGKPSDFRSNVASIGEQVHREIAVRLPFNLHAREFGRHTLYMLSKDDRPHGYVHARSEASQWGMVEIVWSLDEALRVRDFRFQRCRSPQRDYFESKAFRSWVRGRGFSELVEALEPGGKSVSPDLKARFRGREALAVAVVRSALKTIVVTEIAWGVDIAERRLRTMLADYCEAVTIERGDSGDDPALVFIGRDKAGVECGRAVRLACSDTGTVAQGMFVFDTRGECLAVWGGDLCLLDGAECEPGAPAGETQPCQTLHDLLERAKVTVTAAR